MFQVNENACMDDIFFLICHAGSDCANMGGDPDYDEESWGVCTLDLCHAQQDIEVLVANVRGSCDVEAWRGYGKWRGRFMEGDCWLTPLEIWKKF